MTASASISAPRLVLMRMTPRLTRATAASSMRWWVSGVSGQCSEMMSERAMSVSVLV